MKTLSRVVSAKTRLICCCPRIVVNVVFAVFSAGNDFPCKVLPGCVSLLSVLRKPRVSYLANTELLIEMDFAASDF